MKTIGDLKEALSDAFKAEAPKPFAPRGSRVVCYANVFDKDQRYLCSFALYRKTENQYELLIADYADGRTIKYSSIAGSGNEHVGHPAVARCPVSSAGSSWLVNSTGDLTVAGPSFGRILGTRDIEFTITSEIQRNWSTSLRRFLSVKN